MNDNLLSRENLSLNDADTLLLQIEAFADKKGIKPWEVGYKAANDRGVYYDLVNGKGKSFTVAKIQRIRKFMIMELYGVDS